MITQNPHSLTINTSAEIDDDHAASHVAVAGMEFRLEDYEQLHLDIWCAAQDLDVILQRLTGYNAAGAEVWTNVGTEKTLTAASSDAVADVETVIQNLVTGAIPAGRYRVAAQRNGATAAGTLYVFGWAKRG